LVVPAAKVITAMVPEVEIDLPGMVIAVATPVTVPAVLLIVPGMK
jgi:hypothetical protein